MKPNNCAAQSSIIKAEDAYSISRKKSRELGSFPRILSIDDVFDEIEATMNKGLYKTKVIVGGQVFEYAKTLLRENGYDIGGISFLHLFGCVEFEISWLYPRPPSNMQEDIERMYGIKFPNVDEF